MRPQAPLTTDWYPPDMEREAAQVPEGPPPSRRPTREVDMSKILESLKSQIHDVHEG